MKKQLELGEHIKKGTDLFLLRPHETLLTNFPYLLPPEVLALISLKKFRHLRRAYHPNEGPR